MKLLKVELSRRSLNTDRIDIIEHIFHLDSYYLRPCFIFCKFTSIAELAGSLEESEMRLENLMLSTL